MILIWTSLNVSEVRHLFIFLKNLLLVYILAHLSVGLSLP